MYFLDIIYTDVLERYDRMATGSDVTADNTNTCYGDFVNNDCGHT